VFDNQYDSFNLNAFKLTIEKDKDTSKFPAGFRVDAMMGEDAGTVNGAGSLNDNALSVEQAYVDLGIPLGNGIDVKFGKMVTLLGYEVIESPANWQFSRSDAFRLSPMTMAGMTLGYKWNDYLTSTLGVINGYDSGLNGGGGTGITGAGNRNTDFSFIGRLDVTLPKTSIGEFGAFVCGQYGDDVAGPTSGMVGGVPNTFFGAAATYDSFASYIFNLGATWNKPFNIEALGFGADYLYRKDQVNTIAGAGAISPSGADIDAQALSFYGKYDWNKWLTTSGRFSYSQYSTASQRNGAGTAIVSQESLSPFLIPVSTNAGASNGGFLPSMTDNFSYTFTQAFNVWKDTLVRLEWRHDWTTTGAVGYGLAGAGGAGGQNDIRQQQDTIAVNVVYSF